MKHISLCRLLGAICCLFMLVVAAPDVWAQYTPGNLVVLRVGDGAAPLSSSATAINLVEYGRTAGPAINTLPLPTAASGTNYQLTQSGSAGSEGALNLSADGRYLTLVGYDAQAGSAAVVANTMYNRVIGRVDNGRNINTTTILQNASAYNGNNIRSAVSADGTQFWTSGNGTGSAGGVHYVSLGNTTGGGTQLNGTLLNTRVVNIYNGQLYVSSSTTSFTGVSGVGTDLPTTSGQAVTLLAGAANAYAFVFLDRDPAVPGPDLLYVADQTAGILKFSYNGTVWTGRGAIPGGVTGLTGFYNCTNNNVELYATVGTSAGNILFKTIDNAAYNATVMAGTSVTLGTAPANTAFRGVAFAPGTNFNAPTAFNTTGGGAYCGTTAISVGLSGSEIGISYQLLNNNTASGVPLAGTGSALAFPGQTAAGTYTVLATNTLTSCPVTMSGSAVVTVNTPTTANAGPAQTITAGSSATLAANTPTTGTGSWSVASGPSTSAVQFSSTTSPTATFTPMGGAGSYVLTWTISNAPCAPSGSNVTITVTAANQAPVVTAAIPSQTAVVGQAFAYAIPANTFSDPENQPLTLSATGLPGGITFDASTSALTGTPTTTGVSTVTVTATDPGNLTASTLFTITVNAQPGAILTASNNGVLTCGTPTLTLTASATATGGSYTYQFAGPGVLSTAANSATINVAGTYSVTVTDGTTGLSSTTTTTVTSDTAAPTATLMSSNSLNCSVSSATLTAGTGAGYTYTFSAGAMQTGSTNMATVSNAGMYSVVVTAANGCTAAATTTVLSDTATPAATLTASGTLTCANPSVTLTAGTGSNYSYVFSAGATQTGTSNQAVVTAGGSYSVTVTANGCSATTSLTVVEDKTSPVASLSGGVLTCAAPSLTLTAAAGAESYRFSTGQTGTGNQVVVTNAGSYSVLITAANGCTASATSTVTSNTAAPTATLSVSGQLTTASPSVTLTAGTGTGYSYTFSAGATPIGTTNQATVTAAGTYTVTVMGSNGCVASATATVTTNQPPTAPTIVSQTATVGVAFSYTVPAFTDPENQALTYAATGVPAPLTFDPATRVISGTATTAGVSTITITATDPASNTASATFSLSVNAAPVAPAGLIRITEYMYSSNNGAGNGVGEFVELTNVGNAPIDLTGWSFDDNTRMPGSFTGISTFGVVQPNESVIITDATADQFRTFWYLPASVKVAGGNDQNLGRADEINIYDASGTLVDRLSYNDAGAPASATSVAIPSGSIRTQAKSGWPQRQYLGANSVGNWQLSVAGDAQTSYLATTGDLGNPGGYFIPLPRVKVVESGGTTTVTEGGATDTYAIALNSPPTATVTVTINPGSQLTVNSATLTFTPSNYNTAQTVTVTAIDDAVYQGAPRSVTITQSAASSDVAYNGLPVNPVSVTIIDNDVAATAPPTVQVTNTTTPYLSLSATGQGYVSGVIGDPTDPASTLGINFTLADADTPVTNLTVTIGSNNTAVAPVANLALTGTGASRTLKITPAGVGYATITVSVTDGSNTASYVVNYAASAASVTQNTTSTHFHTGTSDASTAVLVDATYTLVGDDENQVLRLYNRQNSGLPVAGFDYTSSLGLTDISGGVPREVDIEASIRQGNRIFWIGSQSNKELGPARPNRDRVFATDISGTGAATTLSYVGRYDYLREDIINWDVTNGHGKGANYYGLQASADAATNSKAPEGYNIEGAELAPDGTTAYIGFRAPQVLPANRTKALVVAVTNLTSLVNGQPQGSATFGAPIELNLGGRGIREIRKNSANQYIISAGPAGDAGAAPNDFRLYTWTGNAADAPVLRTTDLTSLNVNGSFESIVEVPNPLTDASQIQVLVDNGDAVYYTDGTAAKDLAQNNFKKFRSDIVTLGAPVNTAPVATANNSQTATVGTLFSYTVNAFTDAETPTSLTYSASISPANSLTFNPATRVISGMPLATGASSVTVTATDPGNLSASTMFTITVNPAPVVVTSLSLIASANPTTLFTTGTTTLSATVSGGTTPYSYSFTGPGTITASGNTASVSNLPVGVQTFTVVATDATTPASQTISSTVSVTVTAAPATSTTGIVISQVYGGGGNVSATYKNDYIELFNRTNAPISINGWSVQYAAATGTSWQVTPLTGTIPAGGYYLVAEATSNSAVGASLPASDASGNINLSATTGKIALVSTSTPLSGTCPTGGGILDFVGVSTTVCYEGTGATPSPANNTLAALRKLNGCMDSDNNAADFATGATNPRNSMSPLNVCGATVASLSLTVSASPATLLTTGTTSLSATVSGGTTPYSYSFTGPGSITASGNTASVSNLPVGVQTFTVIATDATTPASQTISATVSVTVSAPTPVNTAPVATTNANQVTTVGTLFSYTVNAFTDAETPTSLTYSASISPANSLTFNPATRVISGTPLATGASSVTVTATDPGNLSASTMFTITVNPAPVVVTSLSLTASANPTTLFTTGTTTLSATASGGTAPYSYSFTGLGSITASGNTASVSNLPVGVQTFTVVATDATTPASQTISATVSVTVSAPTPVNTAPVATTNNSQTATVGTLFSYTVNAFTDAETPTSLTYSASISPANSLTFNPATRVISGMPLATGASSVTVTATDPGNLSASTMFTITVNPAPVVVTSLSLTASANPTTLFTTGTTTLSATASGGTAPYSYSFTGPGSITASGNTASVSNLPVGVQTFTVVATDATTPASQTISSTVSVTVTAAPATSTTGIVISQVYGGGGNSGAPYKSDYIELFNRTNAPISINGWSVQYASATGTSWQVTPVTGTIPAGGYYLISESTNTTATSASLPVSDASGTINLSGTVGKVALVNLTTALSGTCPTGASIIDFVGFGTTANCFEGTGPTPAPSNTVAVFRAMNGCMDANQNATDFATGAPAPRNSTSPLNVCGAAPAATLTATPSTLTGFNSTAGMTSVTQTYTLTGANLTGNAVSVTATAGIELSTDNVSFATTLSLPTSASAVSQAVYARLTSAVSSGAFSGTITNTANGTLVALVSVSGNVTAANAPALSVSPGTLSGFTTTQGMASAVQTYTLTGVNLTTVVTVSAPAGYQVSQDGANFQDNITITSAGSSLTALISVRLTGVTPGSFTGSVTNTSTGANPQTVRVSGTVSSTAPVAFTPIATARAGINSTFTVAGRVTVSNQLGARQIYIQDATGGIAVYSGPSGPDFTTLVNIGDSVQVRGPVTVFSGYLELTGSGNFTVVAGASSRVPTPVAITPGQLASYQGQLVSIANATITPVAGSFSGGTSYTITAGGQSNTLRISANSPLSGAGQPANPVSVTGIADRFVSGATTTGSDALQLQPRILADIPGSTAATDLTCTVGSGSPLTRDQTLDIAAWNMEFFGADAGTITCPGNKTLVYNDMGPVNEDLQQSNATQVLTRLNADIISTEEVSDINRFAAAVAAIPGSYSYVCSDKFSYFFQDECDQVPSGNPPTVFGPTKFAQKVCVIYNTATVTPILAETKPLLFKKTADYTYPGTLGGNGSGSGWASGRLPFLFVANVTINGITKKIHVVAVHGKSGSAKADFDRRVQDYNDLKAELDQNYPTANVVILGDYNDKATTSIYTSSPVSSFNSFVTDAANYSVVTKPLEQNGCVTYNPSGGSFIDQITISNDLQKGYLANTAYVLQPFSIPNYGNTTSDHSPIEARFDISQLAGPATALSLTASASPTTLLTTGTTTLSATVSGGTTPYSYSFSGAGTITASGNTATVSNLPAGVQTFTVVARDATTPASQTISATVSVTVTAPAPANTAPVATTNANQVTTVNAPFTYTVNAFSDAETPNSLTYSASISPANGFTFNPITRVISGTAVSVGVSSVTITATDSGSLSASTTFTITANPASLTPVITVSPTALTNFVYTTQLDASASQSYTVSASGLSSALSVSASGPYQVSLDNYFFSKSLTVPVTNSTVLPTRIYVIQTGNMAGSYSGVITNISGSGMATVAVSGTILQATLSATPTTLSNFTTTVGTPSAVQTYTLTTLNQLGVVALAPAGIEIRTGSNPFSSSLTIGASLSTISVPVDVRLSGTSTGPVTGTIVHQSANGDNRLPATTVAVNGAVNTVQPTGPATLTITSFTCNVANTGTGPGSVSFVVGYSNGSFTPALPNLFINGVTVSGQLGQTYSFGFDANAMPVPIQDNASRSTYFVWNFRQACAGPVTPPMPTPPVAPALPNQTATQGSFFSYGVPAFSGTGPISYSATGLPAGLSFDAASRIISGTPSLTGVSTVVIQASNAAGQGSGTFTIAVSASATQPTGPTTLTITSFTCNTTNSVLSSVNFVVGYSNGSFAPALPPLFIVGVTASGQLGQPYTFAGFDANSSTLPIADNASRSVYFVWNFRAACAGPVTPPMPTPPVAPALPNQTATQGSFFSYGVPAFSGTGPISYSATGLPAGLSFDAASRIISGTPSLTGVSTVVIQASNAAGSSSGQFTIAVSASATQPTGPTTLTITSFTCNTTNSVLSSVNFVVGYSNGSFSPTLPNLFINGVTIAGQLGQRYSFGFDANAGSLPIQDNASRSTYFVWDFRAACANRVNGRLSAEPIAPLQIRVLGNPAHELVAVEVTGAEGGKLTLELTDVQGRIVGQRSIGRAGSAERIEFSVGQQPTGILLLRATTPAQTQTVRVLNVN